MAKKTTKKNKAVKPKDDVEVVPMTKQPLEALSEPQEAIVRVRCILPFYDLQAKCERGQGAEFECSEDRADALVKLHLVIVL